MTTSDQDVTMDGRRFSLIRSGRRWTKVPEYLSNGQRTARWFVDEATGEVRMARGWSSPDSRRVDSSTRRFVLQIVEAA